jgi:CspA family cold shock protein
MFTVTFAVNAYTRKETTTFFRRIDFPFVPAPYMDFSFSGEFISHENIKHIAWNQEKSRFDIFLENRDYRERDMDELRKEYANAGWTEDSVGVDPARIHGKVKWYSVQKGYGFVTIADRNLRLGRDIFFHYASFKYKEQSYTIQEGDRLVFDLDNGKYGESAINIEKEQ